MKFPNIMDNGQSEIIQKKSKFKSFAYKTALKLFCLFLITISIYRHNDT